MTSASARVSLLTQSTWSRYLVSWSLRLHMILYTVVNTTFDPFSFTWGPCSLTFVFSLASVILWNTNIWLASILAPSKSNQCDIRPTLWSRLKNMLAYSKNSSNYRYKIILCLCSGYSCIVDNGWSWSKYGKAVVYWISWGTWHFQMLPRCSATNTLNFFLHLIFNPRGVFVIWVPPCFLFNWWTCYGEFSYVEVEVML